MNKINFFIFVLIIFSKTTSAIAFECLANTRDKHHNLVIAKVNLSDLTSNNSFSGEFFEITNSIDDQPILFNDPKLSFRACTAYYHLTKAKNYFIETLEHRYASTLKKIKIRLEMTYNFIDSSHYMNEDFKSYNNSLTIPPSNDGKVSEVKPWNYEIWFAPGKKTKMESSFQQAASLINSKTATDELRLGVISGVGQNIASQLARGSTITSLDGQMYLESLVLSLIVVSATPFIIEKTSSLFKKTLFLDTGLIPEVIYHEYTHLVLSDYLRPSHHSPVLEGMANFFGSDIGGTDTILKKVGRLSHGLDKLDATKKIKFETWMEDQRFAQYGFTFGLLWDIKIGLGNDIGRKIIFLARKKLNSSSTLRVEFVNAIEEVVREYFPKDEQRLLLLKLANIWHQRGI